VFYFSKAEGVKSTHSDNIKTDSSIGLTHYDSLQQKSVNNPENKPLVTNPSSTIVKKPK
jgi:hypothetical protein